MRTGCAGSIAPAISDAGAAAGARQSISCRGPRFWRSSSRYESGGSGGDRPSKRSVWRNRRRTRSLSGPPTRRHRPDLRRRRYEREHAGRCLDSACVCAGYRGQNRRARSRSLQRHRGGSDRGRLRIDLAVSAVSHGNATEPIAVQLLENGKPLEVRRDHARGGGVPVHTVFQVAPGTRCSSRVFGRGTRPFR